MNVLRTFLTVLAALLLAVAPLRAQEAGEMAYRRGDWETARGVWVEALAEASGGAPAERARLCYNLGNAAYRAGDLPRAVGWYSAALRLAPRDRDVWHNLELARSEAGLEPADRGDLADTLARVVGSLTLAESEWLVAGSLVLLAACLVGEALRGGAWRRAAWGAAALVALACLPWAYGLLRAGGAPMLVVAADGASARTHPDPGAESVETLPAGEEVERLDTWPGWVKVLTPRGEERWVQEDRLFDLDR